MSNFPRVKASGWALNEILTSAQMNALDIAHTKALNADDGSNHTPTADYQITGSYGPKLMGSLQLKYEQRTITRTIPLTRFNPGTDSFDLSDGDDFILTASSAGGEVLIELPLPHGAELDEIRLTLKGPSGHVSDPIDPTPPRMYLQYLERTYTAAVNIGTYVEDTDDRTTYEAVHELVMSSIGHTVDRTTDVYCLSIENESGTDQKSGLALYMLTVKCKITAQDEWYG